MFPTVLYVLVATELYQAVFKFSVCTGFLVRGQSLKTAAEDLLSSSVMWGTLRSNWWAKNSEPLPIGWGGTSYHTE